jgi:acyl carrier protein
MTKIEVKEKLKTVFIQVFNNPNIEISDSLTANDVDNWDSLTHMILISEVEKAFSITFKLKELNKMKNVGDMMNLIVEKTNI